MIFEQKEPNCDYPVGKIEINDDCTVLKMHFHEKHDQKKYARLFEQIEYMLSGLDENEQIHFTHQIVDPLALAFCKKEKSTFQVEAILQLLKLLREDYNSIAHREIVDNAMAFIKEKLTPRNESSVYSQILNSSPQKPLMIKAQDAKLNPKEIISQTLRRLKLKENLDGLIKLKKGDPNQTKESFSSRKNILERLEDANDTETLNLMLEKWIKEINFFPRGNDLHQIITKIVELEKNSLQDWQKNYQKREGSKNKFFTFMLIAASKMNNYPQAREIYADFLKLPLEKKSEYVFCSMIEVALENKDYAFVLNVYDEAKKASCNGEYVISAAMKSKDYDFVSKVYINSIEQSAANYHTYYRMINAAINEEKLSTALEVYEDANLHGKANEYIFSCFISAAKNNKEIYSFVKEKIFKEAKSNKKDNACVYSLMINAAANNNDYLFAKEVYEQTQTDDQKRNEYVYVNMINAANKNKNYDFAKEVYDEARKKEKANKYTYSSMINAATDHNDYNFAKKVFKDASENLTAVSKIISGKTYKKAQIYIYRAMIFSAVKNRDELEVNKLITAAKERDLPLDIIEHAHADALLLVGEEERAKTILEQNQFLELQPLKTVEGNKYNLNIDLTNIAYIAPCFFLLEKVFNEIVDLLKQYEAVSINIQYDKDKSLEDMEEVEEMELLNSEKERNIEETKEKLLSQAKSSMFKTTIHCKENSCQLMLRSF